MGVATSMARRLIGPLITVSGLDLQGVRGRLDALGARHAEVSAVLSLDDSPGSPSARLVEMVPSLVSRAARLKLPLLAERDAPALVHLWPGEHYRLLGAIVEELRPRMVLEIGTYTGLSALAMLPGLSAAAQLRTIDILPWDQIPRTFLRASDFSDGRLSQLVCDLGQPESCRAHGSLLSEADLIFVDAAKDGVFERRLLANFASVGLKPGALLVFDDIRLWNMLEIWRKIPQPKLDLTSFGHWSGTGLVDWGAGTSG